MNIKVDIKYIEKILKKNQYTKRALIQKISEDFDIKDNTILSYVNTLLTFKILSNTINGIIFNIKIGNKKCL